jgi:hypothetical protein
MNDKKYVIDGDDFTSDLVTKLRGIPGSLSSKLNLTNTNQILRETFQDYVANRKTVVPYENLKIVSAEAFLTYVSNDLVIRCKTDFYTGSLHALHDKEHIVLGSFQTCDLYLDSPFSLGVHSIVIKYGNHSQEYYRFNPQFMSLDNTTPNQQRAINEALKRAAFIGYKFLKNV